MAIKGTRTKGDRIETLHDNDGLRKRCDCRRRDWSKCPHDWHFNFAWQKEPYRFSLDRYLKRRLKDRTEAKTEADRIRNEIRSGRFNAPAPQLAALTLRQLVDNYVTREMNTKRPGAHDREHHTIDRMLRLELPRRDGRALAFGEWLVSDITTDTIERFREVRTEGGKARIAANRNLAFLRATFNWGIRIGDLERTPFKRQTETVVKLTSELARLRRLEPGESEKLLPVCGTTLRPIVEAALETGCRLGELLSLQWHQVRLDLNRLILPAQKTKTKRDRRIPISGRLRAILELRRLDPAGEPLPADAYVFGNAIGQRRFTIKTAWAAACRRAQITDLHFHDLRREAGSRWLEGGVPLQVVRDWLGHANISQTSTYLGTTGAHEDEAMRRFEAVQAATAVRPLDSASKGPLVDACTAGASQPARGVEIVQ